MEPEGLVVVLWSKIIKSPAYWYYYYALLVPRIDSTLPALVRRTAQGTNIRVSSAWSGANHATFTQSPFILATLRSVHAHNGMYVRGGGWRLSGFPFDKWIAYLLTAYSPCLPYNCPST